MEKFLYGFLKLRMRFIIDIIKLFYKCVYLFPFVL